MTSRVLDFRRVRSWRTELQAEARALVGVARRMRLDAGDGAPDPALGDGGPSAPARTVVRGGAAGLETGAWPSGTASIAIGWAARRSGAGGASGRRPVSSGLLLRTPPARISTGSRPEFGVSPACGGWSSRPLASTGVSSGRSTRRGPGAARSWPTGRCRSAWRARSGCRVRTMRCSGVCVVPGARCPGRSGARRTVGRLPRVSLRHARPAPERFTELAGELFQVMASGGRVGVEAVAWFNGGLFDAGAALPLEKTDVETVAGRVGPRRVGDRPVDPRDAVRARPRPGQARAARGALHRPRERSCSSFEPVVIRPLLAEWDREKAAVAAELERADAAKSLAARTKRRNEAERRYRTFLDRLARVRGARPGLRLGELPLPGAAGAQGPRASGAARGLVGAEGRCVAVVGAVVTTWPRRRGPRCLAAPPSPPEARAPARGVRTARAWFARGRRGACRTSARGTA